ARSASFPSSARRRNADESRSEKHSDDSAVRHIDLPGPPLAPNLTSHRAQRPHVLRGHRAVGKRTEIEQEVVIAGERRGQRLPDVIGTAMMAVVAAVIAPPRVWFFGLQDGRHFVVLVTVRHPGLTGDLSPAWVDLFHAARYPVLFSFDRMLGHRKVLGAGRPLLERDQRVRLHRPFGARPARPRAGQWSVHGFPK